MEARVQKQVEDELAEVDKQVRIEEENDEKRKRLRDIQAKSKRESIKKNAAHALSIIASEEGVNSGPSPVHNQAEQDLLHTEFIIPEPEENLYGDNAPFRETNITTTAVHLPSVVDRGRRPGSLT